MFDAWLSRAIKVSILFTIMCFMFLMVTPNPYQFILSFSKSTPIPTNYTQEEMDAMRESQAQVREILIINQAEFDCLQKNIYFEARNQKTLQAYQAVALVTMKRVASEFYPDSICEVVKQSRRWNGQVIRNKCAFSWFCDGKSDKPNLLDNQELIAWIASGAVALEALKGNIPDFLGPGATHYVKIEDHLVYRDSYDKTNWLDNAILASL